MDGNLNHSVEIDDDGFLYVDGVMVARWIPQMRALEFCDKNKLRSAQRGSRLVRIRLRDFEAALRNESDVSA